MREINAINTKKHLAVTNGTNLQGLRLTFQLSSLVASEWFDFTSQNKFSLARLFLHNLVLCSICLIFSLLKEACNSFFGLGVYLLKSKFRVEDKLRFP